MNGIMTINTWITEEAYVLFFKGYIDKGFSIEALAATMIADYIYILDHDDEERKKFESNAKVVELIAREEFGY